MAGKRKLEFSDIASVEQPVASASVHGVVSVISPKCHREEVIISMER